MKKAFTTLLGCIVLMFGNKSYAQEGLSISVKAVPQFSFLQNKDDNNNSGIDRKATINAAFGLGAGFNISNKVGVAADVLYSLQGQRYEMSDTETNQKNNYIKLPVFFAYNSNPNKPVTFIGKIGLQLSFLTGSRLTNKDGDDIDDDTKDRYQSTNFGGMLSAGTQFKVSRNLFLTTSVRFDYDFTNAEDDSYAFYPAGRESTYNMTTGLEVGLKYFFKYQ